MCPTLEDLYLKTGEPITEDWFEYHYDVHKTVDELLLGVTSVVKYGYVYSSIIPYKDATLDIGRPDLRFNQIFAMTGYFDEDVFIQGRRALKDGDPISLYDIYALAQNKITYAIDRSYYVSLTLPINEKLADIILELEEQTRKLEDIYEKVGAPTVTVGAVPIEDIYDKAKLKITYAIDSSYYVSLTLPINEKLADVLLKLEEEKRSIDNIYTRMDKAFDVNILDLYDIAKDKIAYAIDTSYYVSLTLSMNKKLSDILLKLEEEKRSIDSIYDRLNKTFDTNVLDIYDKAKDKITYAIDKSYYVSLILPINEKLADVILEIEEQNRKLDQIHSDIYSEEEGKPIVDIVKEIRDKMEVMKFTNDMFVGTPTPVYGYSGLNTLYVRSGGDVDFDPSGKYLKSLAIELESNEFNDYISEIAKTDGTTRIVFFKNVPLAFSNKEFELEAPTYIPQGYWIETIIHLASAKHLIMTLEFVW